MIDTYYGIISVISNALGILGFFPEIYSMIYDVEVKITTTVWGIWILSGGLGITYGVCIDNPYVIMSSCTGTGLNIIVFIIKSMKKNEIENSAISADDKIIL